MEGFFTLKLSEDKNALILLDQTKLPLEETYITLSREEDIWDAIRTLKVRGAPALGAAAAYGLYLSVKDSPAQSAQDFLALIDQKIAYFASSRPTAVNLPGALERMKCAAKAYAPEGVAAMKTALLNEAEGIDAQDKKTCLAIAEHALTLLKPGMTLMTICNAGAMATTGIGTALAPIHEGVRRGYGFKVFALETRPLLQGARITCWELMKAGVDVTLICDSAAASVLASGKVNAILAGADRIALNGDSANKIGTSMLGVLAKEYRVPLYILAPLTTLDRRISCGKDIPIEERPGDEVTSFGLRRTAPEGVKAFNPAFDVTKVAYISAIVTETGVIRPPFDVGLRDAIVFENDCNLDSR
ncbi:Methylthioribose-1-phosphate isomerase [bioreactor metagenome]|uniref:Methylthioribose-1-phosphate isomerase n=1 Tax=bioreactor metagenome TaxID=1076179 RepID=A0A645BUA5_9ZZZZ